MLSLNELWFVLIAVLFIGFFFLEGFDFGIGMSTTFLAKSDIERRVLINSIGPFWDANEVWLLTAGGAMFAAFPNWYATLFSGFYLPLVFLLLALIGRGVAFEYRGKVDNPVWRKVWDVAIFIGSFLPPFLLGVVFACLLKGLPIDANMEMNAGLFDMVNLYSVMGGVTVVVLCQVHGLLFATLRTTGDLRLRARKQAKMLLVPLALLLVIFGSMTYFMTDIFAVRGGILSVIAVLGVIAYVLAGYFISKERDGWAFGMTGTVIALSISSVFIGLFPRVMISSIDSMFNLTIQNASSSPYSLKIMTIVALSLLPFVLGYQIWSYFVFHKRVHEKEHLEY
ncbi:cytochrome d ubiquinol oxidase subunit II [Brevibacillus sp. 7WMA2]|uniref:cytochrome d ubiquinol oxidase subunit II n=1 Tax=Brevibacillus TaxID=55080 RepID=UPI000BC3AE45|nr:MULTISPECIES: cytochrome d ubiquinol oxidase subunit II [Brevibacillus]WPS89450.1 cytochrome d ubiquinol oxidase subunit II [Brevibacillus halotolerans]AUM64578.1 cytochrome d ubiquinol oxidase subunit II [Brevibacillus laterosporus]MCR8995052.1 cytochrome d ubiquinol oxidase subunit II [Brevibacillus laterosporus]MDF9411837.1 cytochrome d ubiquinol oxidase subunit II [Brevibacillus laterosporus]PCN42697.1 cytochrome d ubiquinol oxidase subunit II [Brevibacillus laterosporus]